MGKAFKIFFGFVVAAVAVAVLSFGGWYAYKAGPTGVETATKQILDTTKAKVDSVIVTQPPTTPIAPASTSAPPAQKTADASTYGAGAVEGASCTGQKTGKPGVWKMDPVVNRLGCWIGSEK